MLTATSEEEMTLVALCCVNDDPNDDFFQCLHSTYSILAQPAWNLNRWVRK